MQMLIKVLMYLTKWARFEETKKITRNWRLGIEVSGTRVYYMVHTLVGDTWTAVTHFDNLKDARKFIDNYKHYPEYF